MSNAAAASALAFEPAHSPAITPPVRLSLVQWLLLLAIVAAGIGLRCYDLGTDSLWHDELWGMEMAVGHAAPSPKFPGRP